MNDRPGNGFSEYKRLILHELEFLHEQREKHEKRIRELEHALSVIGTKVAFWGAIAGTVAAVIAGVVVALFK